MMKNKNARTVGIIAEYNPFHNGHAYHLERAKELAGAQYVVAVMSGDFLQRGGPAIYDKYTRAAMALQCGADLVLEMPSVFASGSAEDFASCGTALLDGLGVVDSLSFGSENDDLETFLSLAEILNEEPPDYVKMLKEELKTGASYPEAREKALVLTGYLKKENAGFVSTPNNILGLEYCKALLRKNSSIRPIPVTRRGSGYHDENLNEEFSSATAVREAIRKEDCSSLKASVPFPVYCMLREAHPLYPEDFSTLLNAALLSCKKNQTPFSDYLDVSADLSTRIGRSILEFSSFEERIAALKTRQYTYTRVSRALLHILLGIRADDVSLFRAAGRAPYARVLGFRKSASGLLSDIKQNGSIPLVTKTADAKNLLEGPARKMLSQDMYSSHLYQSVYQGKYHRLLKNEFTRSVIILG